MKQQHKMSIMWILLVLQLFFFVLQIIYFGRYPVFLALVVVIGSINALIGIYVWAEPDLEEYYKKADDMDNGNSQKKTDAKYKMKKEVTK